MIFKINGLAPNQSLQRTAAGIAEGEAARLQASLFSKSRAPGPPLPLNSTVGPLHTGERSVFTAGFSL